MRWVTRKQVRLDRAACSWLIWRHIDPDAAIDYLDAEDMPGAVAVGALPFHDTTGEVEERSERTSFDLLLAEYKLERDPALLLFSDVVRGAETKEPGAIAEAEGVRAIAKGMRALAGSDQEMVARMLPVFDALYAYCARRVAGRRGWADADSAPIPLAGVAPDGAGR